ncbi:GDSL-type esterase/lipase family protein [Rhizobium leguminosarum]|uniref:SGNH/GDSL hydrolase family protein n=1 Tax=Rhizobium leguminosarum TaxID=384 RepID=UPI003D0853C5
MVSARTKINKRRVASYIGAGVIGGVQPLLGQYNFKTSQFSKMKAALARVSGGTGRGKIVCVGDSTTWGEGGGDSGSNMRVNAKERCWPTIVAKTLAAAGIPAGYENIYGNGAITTAGIPLSNLQNYYKTGFSPSNAWAANAAMTAGGCLFANATDTSAITVILQTPCDKFELADLTLPGNGIISYSIDGGAAVQLSQNVASSYRRTVIDLGGVAAHTITINRVSGTCFFAGYTAWNSTIPGFEIVNVGIGSAQTAEWVNAATTYGPLNSMTNLASTADLVIIDLTINNAYLSPTTYNTTYPTQMQTIINAARAGGADVMLMTGNPSRVDIVPDSAQQNFRNALKALAVSNDLPMIDQWEKYTDWVALDAAGKMYNANHPNTAGYADLGAFVANTIRRWAA